MECGGAGAVGIQARALDHVSFRIVANAFDGLLSEPLTVKLVKLSPATDK
jgi:hypothetical protein